LSAYAVVQKTLIDGRVYFDREKDLAGRAALEQEKKELLEKARKSAGEKGGRKESRREKAAGKEAGRKGQAAARADG